MGKKIFRGMVSGSCYRKSDLWICNDIGGRSRGFVLAVSKRWTEPEQQYRQWYQSMRNFEFGQIQLVQVEPDTCVANMIGQHKLKRDETGNPPIRYDAVLSCLQKVGKFALENRASVHIPRVGCGLAGGTWDRIEPIVTSSLSDHGIAVTFHDLN